MVRVAKLGTDAHIPDAEAHAKLLRLVEEAVEHPEAWVLFPTPQIRFYAEDGTEIAEPATTPRDGGDAGGAAE